MFVRPLSDEDRSALAAMNRAIGEAMTNRTAWLDRKMEEYALVKLGDPVYDKNGTELGKVSSIYRPSQDDPARDDNFHVEIEFETQPKCFDNSTRQPGEVLTKAELLIRLQNKQSYLALQIKRLEKTTSD